MYKFISFFALSTLFVLNLSACSAPQVTEQRQTNQVEQYNNDNGSQQQCQHSVVIQNNGKTEIHQSSKC